MTTWVASATFEGVRLVDVDADSKPIVLRERTGNESVEAIRRLTAGAPVVVDRAGLGLVLAQTLAAAGVPVVTFNMAEARRAPSPRAQREIDDAFAEKAAR